MRIVFAEDLETVRARVVEDIDTEQERRSLAADGPLSGPDVRRLAASRALAHVQVLRQAQMGAGRVLPPADDDQRLVKAVLDALYGMGPLADLLADPDLIEINLNGAGGTWAKHADGTKEEMPPVFADDGELIAWVQAQAMYTGSSSRAWDVAHPVVELPLDGGHRLVGIRDAGAHPYVSIRLLRLPTVTLGELRDKQDFDSPTQHLLESFIAARFSVCISGGTESAKTTLLRALCRAIDRRHRVMVVENFPELGLSTQEHPDVVSVHERPANAEGVGAITMDQLVRVSRRMNPDWLIVGEVMGEETPLMLEALTQGVPGMTTIHTHSARSVPSRIATYAAKAGMATRDATMLASQALDFIVHLEKVRLPSGIEGRKITSIVEVLGHHSQYGEAITSEVFTILPGQEYLSAAAPLSDARSSRLAQAGWRGWEGATSGTGQAW